MSRKKKKGCKKALTQKVVLATALLQLLQVLINLISQLAE